MKLLFDIVGLAVVGRLVSAANAPPAYDITSSVEALLSSFVEGYTSTSAIEAPASSSSIGEAITSSSIVEALTSSSTVEALTSSSTVEASASSTTMETPDSITSTSSYAVTSDTFPPTTSSDELTFATLSSESFARGSTPQSAPTYTTTYVSTSISTCSIGETVTHGSSTTVLSTPSTTTVHITKTTTVGMTETETLATKSSTSRESGPVSTSSVSGYASALQPSSTPTRSSRVSSTSRAATTQTYTIVRTTTTTCPIGYIITNSGSTSVLPTPSVSTYLITFVSVCGSSPTCAITLETSVSSIASTSSGSRASYIPVQSILPLYSTINTIPAPGTGASSVVGPSGKSSVGTGSSARTSVETSKSIPSLYSLTIPASPGVFSTASIFETSSAMVISSHAAGTAGSSTMGEHTGIGPVVTSAPPYPMSVSSVSAMQPSGTVASGGMSSSSGTVAPFDSAAVGTNISGNFVFINVIIAIVIGAFGLAL